MTNNSSQTPHQKYLIVLRPLSPFFFGGENTFGNDNENYLVKSNYYPQQTTLLGLIRYQLLHEAGLLLNINQAITDIDKAKAKELIGSKSFGVNDTYSKNDFGNIDCLSPVFLHDPDTNKDYWIAPFNRSYQPSTITDWQLQVEADNTIRLISHKEYTAKEKLTHYIVGCGGERKTYEDMFTAVEKIGIKRNNSHKPHTRSKENEYEDDDEKGYYKQTSFCLNKKDDVQKSYCFAFYVCFKTPQQLTNGIVHIGGERSAFMLEAKAVEAIPDNYGYPISHIKSQNCNNSQVQQMVLIADTYVEQNLLDHCLFGITEVETFRFLQTDIDKTQHYFNLSDKNATLSKSRKYQLLKRGSVLYFRKEKQNDLTQLIDKHEDFRQIGYNQYIIVSQPSNKP
ncbi:MAG: hypothetical protein JNM36_12695 [Chitinophagales bacterium]|nr:hypothetical protein [Chitinophagales bacterium]